MRPCHSLFVGTLVLPALGQSSQSQSVFLISNNDANSYTIGNDVWNVTINKWGFGKQLFYKGQDLVGNASGHYVSYSK
jgi:rhamnogalacturonan endolyase